MSELKASKYQAYPEYMDSGVEWLRKIPSHWRAIPLKFIVDTRKGVAFKSSDFISAGVRVVKASDIKDLTINSSEVYLPTSYISAYPKAVLREGEIILSTVGSNPDVKNSAVGQTGVVPEHLHGTLLNQNTVVFESNKNIVHGVFLFKVIQMNGYRDHLDLNAHGTANQSSLSIADMLNFYIPLPPKKEQAHIANFLDHETAKIDTLIEKQQQLIKLLKEKRQAVISHAVTKGIPNKEHPNVPMKDSGVEWLGKVPEHWGVKRNKHLMEFVTSGSRGWAEYYSDDGSLFFRITNLTRDTVEPKLESIQNVEPPAGSEGERSKIRSGDLLISITADLGSVCVADDSVAGGFVSQHVSLCRPNSLVISSRWLAYFILSDAAKEQFIGSGYGGTKIQLSLEDIRELNIAYPPVNEQEEIALYIDTQLEKFALLINRAESQVNLLKERRTALISAAVTGKIDVRNWERPNE